MHYKNFHPNNLFCNCINMKISYYLKVRFPIRIHTPDHNIGRLHSSRGGNPKPNIARRVNFHFKCDQLLLLVNGPSNLPKF